MCTNRYIFASQRMSSKKWHFCVNACSKANEAERRSTRLVCTATGGNQNMLGTELSKSCDRSAVSLSYARQLCTKTTARRFSSLDACFFSVSSRKNSSAKISPENYIQSFRSYTRCARSLRERRKHSQSVTSFVPFRVECCRISRIN